MDVTMIIDTFWVLLAAILVFFMNLGFAAVEAGFARAKNTVNILSKNFIVFAVSSLGFLLLGWGLMFGGDNPFVGTSHLFILGGGDLSFYDSTLTSNVPFWGKFFFHNVKTKHVFDYLNSGVLLLNMPKIKETNLFAKVRQMMQTKKMFLPDQSAINKLAVAKRVFPRYYNEQYKLQKNTKIQHFTTSFRFWPYFHTQTVKPWDVDRVHSVLHLHEYDDILTEYLKIRHNLKK